MIDVTKNNWILPLDGEFYNFSDRGWVKNMALGHVIKNAGTPTFSRLNTFDWWYAHFMKQPHKTLCQTQKALKLPTVGKSKSAIAGVLAGHFRELVS